MYFGGAAVVVRLDGREERGDGLGNLGRGDTY